MRNDQGSAKQNAMLTRKGREYAYDGVRDRIRSGDILLYKGTGFISLLVRKLTRSSYSHAGIAVWWNERLMVMEAVGRGVVVTPLSRNVAHYHGNVDWYQCRKQLSEQVRRRMVVFAQEELGKSYATWKLLLFGLRILLQKDLDKRDALRRENKLYCSWYVAQIYNAAGLDLKRDTSDRFTSPDNIATSPLMVRKGTLR